MDGPANQWTLFSKKGEGYLMPKRATKRATKIVFGMMGPFTIGHAGTAQRQTKLKLAYAINHIVQNSQIGSRGEHEVVRSQSAEDSRICVTTS